MIGKCGDVAPKQEPPKLKIEASAAPPPAKIKAVVPVKLKVEAPVEPPPAKIKAVAPVKLKVIVKSEAPGSPRPKTKNVGKVASGKRLACHAGASAWRTACLELGYLTQGVSKKLPKKGTQEYAKLKKLQDEKIRADPLNRIQS